MNIKKRIISMTLCLVMVMTAFPLTDISEIFPVIVASAEGETYYGDLNENGRVEASDARLVLQKAASLITLTDRQMRLADCNQDGKITAIDARTALRTAARLETPIVFENAEIITQGEFITNLMNELGFAGTGNAEQFFENVTPGDECFDAVQAAVEWGILDADSDFDPDKEATVDFTVDIATAALQYDNIAEDIILTDSSTDRTEDCSKDTATEIIQKAKEYRLNEEPEAEFENIVIKDTVETFDASEITAVSESEFTFNSFGDEAPQNGDIFIAESEKGQTAEKIVSVAENGDGTYSVTTVQPDMDEVFDDFSFVDTATPDIDKISFTPAPGAFVIDDADDFEMLAEGRKKDEDKDVFGIALSLNSTDTPGMLPDMCCTLSSDYIDALNMTAENKDVPSMKKILEDYNQKIDLLTGGDGKTTAVATPVKKYESGWTLDAAIKFSNFEVDFDFKDFWTKGNYSISFLADVTEYIDFEGTLNAEKHLGTLHFSHGIQRIFFDVDIELYAYIDINGKVIVSGQGKIAQTYGNFDGKTDTLNNNAFKPHLEANINAEAGIKVCPGISTLGFDLAEVGIQIGLNGNADFKATLMVDYKDSLYYYAGDVLNLPDGLSMTFLGCLTLELSYPIIRVSVSAGEDVKKQIEKMKKKNEELPDIPLDHTFEICTLSEKSLLTPITNSVHMELANELNTVDKCTADSYSTLAHMCSGYVVKKDTDEVLPDATVELIDKNDKVVSSATTDINGEFDLRFIPYGDYSVKIAHDGTEMTLDEKFTIDKNESNIGKLEFSTKNIWEEIPDNFVFTSGVGGWRTNITISEDGSFVGQYLDSNYNEAFICDFNGKFSNPIKINDYVYSTNLESLTTDQKPGKVYYENGIKYTTSEPYGLNNGKQFLIYMPGMPLSEMSEHFLSWSFINTSFVKEMPAGKYGLFNISEKFGFNGTSDNNIWGKDYYYYYGTYKSALQPSYSSKSHFLFWPTSGAATINLGFNWERSSQEQFYATDYNGSGNYFITIKFSDNLSIAKITLVSEKGIDLSPWGGTKDGKLTAEYKIY